MVSDSPEQNKKSPFEMMQQLRHDVAEGDVVEIGTKGGAVLHGKVIMLLGGGSGFTVELEPSQGGEPTMRVEINLKSKLGALHQGPMATTFLYQIFERQPGGSWKLNTTGASVMGSRESKILDSVKIERGK